MMILVPFFVSFVIRTVQWNFILGTNGLLFGPLKSLGSDARRTSTSCGRRSR